ncbi:MAG: TetR/AcrR family transcriptional regulator, partial [Dermatophilaceae bacterium]
MKSRKYDMGARQQAKTATRDAIIKAAVDTFMAERSFAITLPAVAERADVTVKTVLRHFGSRDALVDAAWSRAYDDVMAERTPPSEDPDDALNVLIAHYERRGDVV